MPLTFGPKREYIPICIRFADSPGHLLFPGGYVENKTEAIVETPLVIDHEETNGTEDCGSAKES